jgi:hypothetical protein
LLEHIYRIIILVAIFIASLNYFSKDIKEVVFDIDNTTVMEEATFPLVTIKTEEEVINLLHGYSSNLDANKLREFVTPLGLGQEYEVIINQKEYDIKKLNYEIREFLNNELIESDSVSVFQDQGEEKIAKIKFHTELIPEKEYAVKITLISSKSQKMYYYHRIKIYEDAHLREQLSFIRDIHNATFNKKAAQDITKYLEYDPESDATSLAYVNIHSSFDLITWGNLKPVILTKIVPSVIEIYSDIAMVRLDYFIEAEIDGNAEQFQVTEFYRVRYSENRMFLLNYERWMEAQFDVNLASIAKSQFKLGISSNYQIPYLSSADGKKLAFVRNRELWFYNMDTNEIFKVFSFRQQETDYIRDLYDQHDIRILNMDAEGNMDFIVYGYMNRGQYEGKVALVLYRYIRAENRNEELVYIPVDEPYQTLKENIGEFAYVNSRNVFYFHMYHNIYSYDLITRKLSSLTDGVEKDQVVVLDDLNYVAWQDKADPKLAENIYIIDMESGEIHTVSTKPGYNILLMDKIDSNIIYGYVKKEDMITHVDGRGLNPLSEVEIISVDKKVLKRYKESGYFVRDLIVKDNIVELFRLQKVENGDKVNYIQASPDYIMNQVRKETPLIEVTTRVTEQALTELYLTLPSGFAMTELPKISSTVNTIISQDPTVRLSEVDQDMTYYYPYIQGRIEGAYKEAAGAIEVARDQVGVVLDSNMQLIWERGVKVNSKTISGFDHLNWLTSSNNTMEICLKLLLNHQGVSVSQDRLSLAHRSALDLLSEYSKHPPVRLTGITLDDALYYVSTNRPVIAMTNTEDAVLIYGFDAFNIMVINPKLNKVERMGLNDSAKLFEEAGNVFISILY